MSHLRSGLSLAIALVLVVCGCASDDPEIQSPVTSEAAGGTATSGEREGAAILAARNGTELVAQANEPTVGVWSSPAESDAAEQTLDVSDQPGGRIVLLVKQELGAEWLEVYLPNQPAGSTGWVRREDVTVSQHRFRIEVDRAAHTLTLLAGEVEVLETPVALGTTDTPAADDGLFIKDLVETPNPDGPYGRYAYGLAGSDNEVGKFRAGYGVVAIHGTDDEGDLGSDVPQGSIAIAEDALDRLVSGIGLPLGTPVTFVG
jgi:hypothetical protein